MSPIPSGDFRYDVFLAHSGGDAELVEALARRLKQEGLRPFYSKWHLIPGELWQDKLEEAIEQSATVAICFGPAARAPWRDLEMQIAQDRATKYPDWRVIPILLEGARPENVRGFLGLRTWIDLRAGLADTAAVERLVAGIQGRPAEPDADPPSIAVKPPRQLQGPERSASPRPGRRLELLIAPSSKRVWIVALLGLVVALLAGGRPLYEWVQRKQCNFGGDVEAARTCYLAKAVRIASQAAAVASSGGDRSKERVDSLLRKALQFSQCADSLRRVMNEIRDEFPAGVVAHAPPPLHNGKPLVTRPSSPPPTSWLLTVEALDARHGAGLIVHYGSSEKPRFMLVDGGPVGTYDAVLKPRLEAIRRRWAPGARLPLDLVVATHGDRTHLGGLQELVEDQARRANGTRLYDIRDLWYNGFAAHERARANAGEASDLGGLATGLEIRQNEPWSPLVMAPPSGAAEMDWLNGLTVSVVAPQWERVRDVYATGSASAINRSSIVLMLEAYGKKVLLTGDATASDILQALERANYLWPNLLHVDLLEVPFEGNESAVTPEFFQRVTADHYLVSGNGANDNPSLAMLQMLLDTRAGERCTIHFVVGEGDYDLRMRLEAFFAAARRGANASKCEARYREPDEPSIRIDLLGKVDY